MLQGPTKCGAFLAVLLLHIAIVSASQAGKLNSMHSSQSLMVPDGNCRCAASGPAHLGRQR
jgi:hypothetical protein